MRWPWRVKLSASATGAGPPLPHRRRRFVAPVVATMPVTRVAAVLAAKRRSGGLRAPRNKVSAARLQAHESNLADMKRAAKTLEKYDKDGSCRLQPAEVKQLLTDMNEGTEPTVTEQSFIMKLCDDTCENGSLDLSEITEAVNAWKTYIKQKDAITEEFVKFDSSQNGKLEKSELKKYLMHLNDGIDVSDDEVDWVMSQGDVFGDGACTAQELVMASAAWYTHIEEKKSSTACTLL